MKKQLSITALAVTCALGITACALPGTELGTAESAGDTPSVAVDADNNFSDLNE